MSSDSRLNSLIEENARQLWPDEAFSSVQNFQAVMLPLVGDAKAAAVSLDIGSLKRIFDTFWYAQPRCTEEPLASGFDHGATLIAMAIAEALFDLRLFESAYVQVSSLMNMIKAANERQKKAGIQVRGYSQLRYLCLKLVANIKWQDIEQNRNRYWSPEWMMDEYDRIYQVVVDYCNEHFKEFPDKEFNYMFNLAWCEYALLKMAARFLPEKLNDLVDRFNQRHSEKMEVEVSSNRYESQFKDSPLYFDFEIAKAWISGRLTHKELNELHTARMNADATFPASYWNGFELEKRHLSKYCSSQTLQVIGGDN